MPHVLPISPALHLVYWRDPRKSLAAFISSLMVLVAMATLSVISVVSYLLLACLCVTITFRVYKSVIQAVQKSHEGHPFRSQLDRDISVSPESARQLAERCRNRLNWLSVQTRRLLLVEDLVDSLKVKGAASRGQQIPASQSEWRLLFPETRMEGGGHGT
uniref:Reticulon n=1 Tax=Poecilia mexicana TaxID=48701 RepID=A0A3B3XFF0_9TELE